MKILFINPPKIHNDYYTLRDEICFQDVRYKPFPIRLAQLIPLIEESFDIEILDANIMGYSWSDVETWLAGRKKQEVQAIIFQSAAGLIKHDLKIAKCVKKILGYKTMTILIESVVAPVYPKRFLSDFPDLDFIVRGQPEVIIPNLLKNRDNLDKIKGLAFRENGEIKLTEAANPIDNLDQLPFMNYSQFDVESYSVPIQVAPFYEKNFKGIRMRTTRDCPYGCPFCIIGSSIWRGYNKKWRAMSPKRVVDEVQYVLEKYHLEAIFFWDETFTLDQKRAEKICDLIIDRNLSFYWRCLTRIDCVNKNLLEKMRQAGCLMIEYGLESGNPDVRNQLKKRFSNDDVIKVVKQTRDSGINVNCDFIIGLPWETNDTLKDTLSLAKEVLADNVHLTMAFPYPDTDFYRIAKQENLIEVDDLYQLMMSERVRVGANPVARSRELSMAELGKSWSEIRGQINRYYLRQNVLMKPWKVFSYLKYAKNPREIALFIWKGLKIIKNILFRR